MGTRGAASGRVRGGLFPLKSEKVGACTGALGLEERERERNLVLEVCDLRGKTQRAFGSPDVNSEFLQDADRLPI